MPRDIRTVLSEVKACLLRGGYEGHFYAEPFGQVIAVRWTSSWGSSRDEDRALRMAAEALTADGRTAQWIPGGGWTRVMPMAADLIDADAPEAWRDHEHGRDSDPPMAAE
jgi:hypothetical protein